MFSTAIKVPVNGHVRLRLNEVLMMRRRLMCEGGDLVDQVLLVETEHHIHTLHAPCRPNLAATSIGMRLSESADRSAFSKAELNSGIDDESENSMVSMRIRSPTAAAT